MYLPKLKIHFLPPSWHPSWATLVHTHTHTPYVVISHWRQEKSRLATGERSTFIFMQRLPLFPTSSPPLSVWLTLARSLLLSLIYISPLMVTMVTVKLVYSRSRWRLHRLLSVTLVHIRRNKWCLFHLIFIKHWFRRAFCGFEWFCEVV